MDDKLEEDLVDSEDFDLDDLEEEESELEFDSDEIEDHRDMEGKDVKFKNPTLHVNMEDEHHCNTYIIPDDQRTTSQVMTLEEMTEAIGIRVTEIENGAPVFTDVEGYTCPIEMAKKELLDGKSPLILERTMKRKKGMKLVEMWVVNDMTLPITRREELALTNKQIAETLQVQGRPVQLPKSKAAPAKKTPAKKSPPKAAPKPKTKPKKTTAKKK